MLSKSPRIGRSIGRGFDTFFKNPLAYIGFTVIFFVASLVITALPPFLNSLLNLIAISPLAMGFASYATFAQTGENKFENFFHGFQRILPLAFVEMTITLVTLVIVTIVAFVIDTTLSSDLTVLMESVQAGVSQEEILADYTTFAEEHMSTFYIMIVLLWIVRSFFLLAPYIAMFERASGMEAIRKSFVLSRKYFHLYMIFILVAAMMAIVGLVFFVIGILAAVPIISLSAYYLYLDATKHEVEEMVQDADIIDL